MKKYIIELTEEQLMLAARSIEDISRYASGQTELSNTHACLLSECDDHCEKRNEIEALLNKAKHIIYPGIGSYEYHGYTGESAPHKSQQEIIANSYQVYRTLIHFVAVANQWNNVYSSPTLPAGNIGQPKLIKVIDEP